MKRRPTLLVMMTQGLPLEIDQVLKEQCQMGFLSSETWKAKQSNHSFHYVVNVIILYFVTIEVLKGLVKNRPQN